MRRGLFLFAIGLGMGASHSAWSLVTLKQIQVSNHDSANDGSSSQVDLLFDTQISKGQIKTEFFNDIIQLSLNDVSVYPAKISSVNGGDLTKVFAYQYAPKLVRCRLSVKGNAEDYKDKIQIIPSGNMLTIHLASLQSTGKRPTHTEKMALKIPQDQSDQETEENHALLEKVLQKPVAASVNTAAGAVQAESAQKPLATGKPMPSMYRALGKIVAVMMLFCAIALGMKKFFGTSSTKNTRLVGFLSRWVGNASGRSGKMIEVLANHYLGPKKRIAVIRVAGRTLVIGITNDSINLITQLSSNPSDMNVEFEDQDGFASVLQEESVRPNSEPTRTMENLAENTPSIRKVRDQIRNKIEGMKPL